MKKLILASVSPTRKTLLTQLGYVFEVIPSNYEEDMTLPMPVRDLVVHLSKGKAEAVAAKNKGVILAADTVIVFGDNILGKPHTRDKAKEMLSMLNGKEHLAITGLTVLDTESNKIISKIVETKVSFKNLTEKEIDDYVATDESLNKAGGYGILEFGGTFVKKIEGSKENVAGLPMAEVVEILKEFGI